MQVLIKVDGDSEGPGLMAWLHADPVSKQAELSAVAGEPGQMGAGEIIQAVTQDSIALGNLLVAVGTWWDARRRRPGAVPTQVFIERGEIHLTVTSTDPDDIQRIVESLTCRDDNDLDQPQ
ncbi:effector-associated constant component EACC1 [Streptomyces mirabilis]|uniref:effector-associated constant component EACC1 n=1 Tax=Streptomyces mirabilis TaxID=68239 RepID=UPI0036928A20